jgi:hypothetical protein
MADSRDHTKISTTNIIKPAMEALPADDQRPFEDLVMRDEKEVMRQWNEQRDKEEAELLHKLSERRKEAAEKYLSHFTVDRHQKIICQGEIDMESLLPPLQGPAVSTPDLSLTTFMDQRGDHLKQYVDESIKMHLRAYEKSAAPSFPSRESNTEPPASNTSTINGSPLTQPSYGMPMHTFVSPSQPQPLGTRQVLDATGPSAHHLRQSGYTADRPAYFAGPSDQIQARTQNTQVAPYMVGPPGYNHEQFGPITDRPVHHVGPSGYVADRPPSYVGPSGYGMNRPTYYAGPSDSTRLHAHTAQVAPYMADPSGYSPGPFGPIADRPVLYDRRSGYETTHAAPYTAGQSGYTFGPFGQVTDHPASYVGPSGYAYTEPRAAQYAQFPHSSQQHYGAPPATHYNHTIPPHGHRAEYCSAIREPERYRAGAGDINRTPSTHLKHPWEESRQSDVRQPEISTHNSMDGRQIWRRGSETR